MEPQSLTYCEPCALPRLAAWKGWPQRDAIPPLPRLIDGRCQSCALAAAALDGARIGWLNIHRGECSSLPDYWRLVIDNAWDKWGRPYFGETECRRCGRRAIVSEHPTDHLRLDCACCGIRRLSARETGEATVRRQAPEHPFAASARRWRGSVRRQYLRAASGSDARQEPHRHSHRPQCVVQPRQFDPRATAPARDSSVFRVRFRCIALRLRAALLSLDPIPWHRLPLEGHASGHLPHGLLQPQRTLLRRRQASPNLDCPIQTHCCHSPFARIPNQIVRLAH